jgi:hypothetical protein
MNVPVSVILVLMVVVAAVTSLGYYAWTHLQSNPHPEDIPVSNVIPFRRDTKNSVTYYINFRVVCKNIPLRITDYYVQVVLWDGSTKTYHISPNSNGYGTTVDWSKNLYLSVSINPASVNICTEKDYNKGKDMVMTVAISYTGTGTVPMENLHLNYVRFSGKLATGTPCSGTIYLPESSFNIGG